MSREEIKRLRQKQRETGMSECDYFLEECCCGASGASCCPGLMGNSSNDVAAAPYGDDEGGGNNGGNGGGRDNCAFAQGRSRIYSLGLLQHIVRARVVYLSRGQTDSYA